LPEETTPHPKDTLRLPEVRPWDVFLWAIGRRHSHRVVGDSMLPTLRAQDRILAKHVTNIHPGDIVIAHHPSRKELLVIKRVVDINDAGLFLQGDNPQHSTDSRTLGTFPFSSILGLVVARFPTAPFE